MKSIFLLASSAALLSACAAPGPETAWGKPGISKVDYVTDLGTCSAMSAMAESGNGANTAGGINGKNNSAPTGNGGDAAKASSGGSSAGAAVPMGNGVYRDSAPSDLVNRAATQQQSQQMAAQRARAEAFKSCYVERGYQEFKLTHEQREHLGMLKRGSNEYLQYLAEIGTDATVQKGPAAQ